MLHTSSRLFQRENENNASEESVLYGRMAKLGSWLADQFHLDTRRHEIKKGFKTFFSEFGIICFLWFVWLKSCLLELEKYRSCDKDKNNGSVVPSGEWRWSDRNTAGAGWGSWSAKLLSFPISSRKRESFSRERNKQDKVLVHSIMFNIVWWTQWLFSEKMRIDWIRFQHCPIKGNNSNTVLQKNYSGLVCRKID